ncbi:MAG: NAD/NADP octopine/nopaline dehydrogenase family protein [Tissierellaceae bacterium]
MKITVIGAGNSGLAMAAHLAMEGYSVRLWNRSQSTIDKLIKTKTIHVEGIINGQAKLDLVTTDMKEALKDSDLILVTTPASSHKDIAKAVAENIQKETLIILNPGRTFGALEFKNVYEDNNHRYKQTIAETQTIIYTCRKTGEDSVAILSFKSDVLLSGLDSSKNEEIIASLPKCINQYFKPAKSIVETSIGNVGMILHPAPLLLNTGWTENPGNIYKYYYDGITPTIGNFGGGGSSPARRAVGGGPRGPVHLPTPKHRYIFEDIPCGLVPLESVGLRLGLDMTYTSLIIDLACKLLEVDFREIGRR